MQGAASVRNVKAIGKPTGNEPAPIAASALIASRVTALNWAKIGAELDAHGCAVIDPVLTRSECETLAMGYDTSMAFRSRVVMSRHGFGQGEYKYYAYPLPDLVAALRTTLYPPLAEITNRWETMLGHTAYFPPDHAAYLASCHEARQTRPTPLLLRYGPGDYNCLHQDLYGDLHFPLQVVFLLSQPGQDFTGGEFVLTEQRPRMQSRAQVVPLRQGEGVVFAVNQRPVVGTRGVYRVVMRHGVSQIRSGRRYTVGLIFHDAR